MYGKKFIVSSLEAFILLCSHFWQPTEAADVTPVKETSILHIFCECVRTPESSRHLKNKIENIILSYNY